MTVAYDAFSSATVGTGDLSWSHTPVGTPRGVIVYIILNAAYADEVIGVTYGGVAMQEVSGSPLLHSTGETATVFGYFLGEGIPTGTQTVLVDVNAGGSTKEAGCISVTEADKTEIVDVDATINNVSLENPSVTLSLGGRIAAGRMSSWPRPSTRPGDATAPQDRTLSNARTGELLRPRLRHGAQGVELGAG